MNRYHVKTGFDISHIDILKKLSIELNAKKWQYSNHCLDNLKYRIIDIKALLLFIKNIKLNYESLFEYYSEGNNIIKVCYRIPFNMDMDIILILSHDKNIITIYLNTSGDNHITLKTELYNKI